MNFWRRFQLFSLRLPIGKWIVASLIFAVLFFGINQIQQQKKTAKTAAIQRLLTETEADNVELEQLKRDIAAWKKRGSITAEERRSIQTRLDEQQRKAKIIQSELEAIARN